MGWLEDLDAKRIYKYENQEKDIVYSGTKVELREIAELTDGEDLSFESGDSFKLWDQNDEEIIFTYAGFEPSKMGMMMKTTFEKNGRKAVRVKTADGKSHVRSMTRENLMKGKGVRETDIRYNEKGEAKGRGQEVSSAFTKGFTEHTNKLKEKVVHTKLDQMKRMVAQSNAQRSKK